MLQVQTDRPVYSNAKGDGLSKLKGKFKGKTDAEKATAKTTRESDKKVRVDNRTKNKTDRVDKRATNKANRRLKRFKKNGTPLTKIGAFFHKKIRKLFVKDGKKVKTNADGTTTEVAAKNVVVTPQGEFDKVEVARALNVTPEQVTPELIAKSSVATQPTTTPVASEVIVPVTASADLAIKVPEALTEVAIDGNPYLSVDLQEVDEEEKDVAKEEQAKQPLVKWEKIMLVSGITLAAIVIGVIAYKRLSK